MLILSREGDEKLQNRQQFINAMVTHPIVMAVAPYGPLLAGGFPTAVFNSGRKHKGSSWDDEDRWEGTAEELNYSDIDMWARDQLHYNEMFTGISRDLPVKPKASTEVATTWKLDHRFIQLVTHTGSSEEIISGFDLYNSMFGYLPEQQIIIYSEEGVEAFKKNELWINENAHEGFRNEGEVSRTIFRIKKYCDRYELNLSESSAEFLLKKYTEFPVLKKTPGVMKIARDSGGMNGNFSHWGSIATLLVKAIPDLFDRGLPVGELISPAISAKMASSTW